MSNVAIHTPVPNAVKQFLAFFMIAVLSLLPTYSKAHSLDASYAGIFIDDDLQSFSLLIEVNLEALVAGVDLSLTDTNDSPNAAEYNRLRALGADELKAASEEFRQALYDGVAVQFDGKEVPFNLTSETFQDVGDLEKPRVTGLRVAGSIPEGAKTLSFGWDEALGPIIFRTVGARTRLAHIQRLEPGERSETLELSAIKTRDRSEMFLDFIVIGYEHIVPKGLDHILFVTGIFLLSVRLRPLLTQITTFTVAHTVTLGLGASGWISLSPAIVEPLIAASIVYVAVENIFTEKLTRWRPLLVFGFGLLHGLGFAGILTEFALEPDDFLFGLLAFNVGVELGQLSVIAVCFLLVGIWFGRKPWYHTRIVIPGSLVIALIASYWVLERTIL